MTPLVLMGVGLIWAVIGAALFGFSIARSAAEHPYDAEPLGASEIMDSDPGLVMYLVGMVVGPALFVAGLGWWVVSRIA
jgi:hypothetical protein